MTVKDYRKVLQILDSKSLPDKQKKEQLIKLMWGNVQTPVNSVLGKLDMIFLGALSNEGKRPIQRVVFVVLSISISPPRISQALPKRGQMQISTPWTALKIFRLSSMPHRIRRCSERLSWLLHSSPTCPAQRR